MNTPAFITLTASDGTRWAINVTNIDCISEVARPPCNAEIFFISDDADYEPLGVTETFDEVLAKIAELPLNGYSNRKGTHA